MPLENQPQLQAAVQLRGGPVATGRFKPGASGNRQTQFKPRNQYCCQPRQSGNPEGIARNCRALIKSLETDSNPAEHSRESPSERRIDRPAGQASKSLPPGIGLYQGELRIRFTTAADLAAKLSTVSEAPERTRTCLRADSEPLPRRLRLLTRGSRRRARQRPL